MNRRTETCSINQRFIDAMKKNKWSRKRLSIEMIKRGLLHLDGIDIQNIKSGKLNLSYEEAKIIADILQSTPEYLFPYFLDYPEDIIPLVNLPIRLLKKYGYKTMKDLIDYNQKYIRGK